MKIFGNVIREMLEYVGKPHLHIFSLFMALFLMACITVNVVFFVQFKNTRGV